MTGRKAITALLVPALLALVPTGTVPTAAAENEPSDSTVLVSRTASGEAAGASTQPAVAASGKRVAFVSASTSLVGGTETTHYQVYLWRAATERVSLVSHSRVGAPGNCQSTGPAISADGRFVVFSSCATNLVRSPSSDGEFNIFRYDAKTGTTMLISRAVTPGGTADGGCFAAAISAHGRFVTWGSDASNLVVGHPDPGNWPDIFVYDRATRQTSLVSMTADGQPPTAGSYRPDISDNGRVIVFESGASNIVADDANPHDYDVFAFDQRTGTNRLLSSSWNGEQTRAISLLPSVSADGVHAAWTSFASNLVRHDDNNQGDVFTHNLRTGRTRLVSVSPDDVQGDDLSSRPDVSAHGRYVAFSSAATNLGGSTAPFVGDVFRRDMRTGALRLVSRYAHGSGDGESIDPAIARGLVVTYESRATNLHPADTDSSPDILLWRAP